MSHFNSAFTDCEIEGEDIILDVIENSIYPIQSKMFDDIPNEEEIWKSIQSLNEESST